MSEVKRPTKKQRELLSFIDGFIKGNGYGPSYREVMRALDYKSVSTVATHVDGLIRRGFLHKKDHSARSLEVITVPEISVAPPTKMASVPDTLTSVMLRKIAALQLLATDDAMRQIAHLRQAAVILDIKLPQDEVSQ